MNQPELWLIRHGETAWSRERRHTGRTDIPLTPEGEAAAVELKAGLADVTFDLILASPLGRAWRTAELAGLRPQPEPLAVEWDYGDYEGVTTMEIRRQHPGWKVWQGPVPRGETLDEVAARADALIDRIRARASERALLVAHGHFSRVLAMRWIEQPPQIAEHFRMETTKTSVLGWDRGVPIIERWNT